MTTNAPMQAFGKTAETCSSHRMRIVSNEAIPVNPRYDNGTQEPDNIKEYRTTYKCSGTCQQSITYTTKNQ